MKIKQTPTWRPFKEITDLVSKILASDKWSWARNNRCKYITIRIDTRDGHALLFDRNGTPLEDDGFKRQLDEILNLDTEETETP